MTKIMHRQGWARGWLPSADDVNCPKAALLRMDNCILDDRGIVRVRQGSDKINSAALSELDIHSLYTAYIDGVRYRMVGSGTTVYGNEVALKVGMADGPYTASQTLSWKKISFGSYLGQIFFARGNARHAWDGTTFRNWGLTQPSDKPTCAAIAADGKVFSTCAQAESPGFVDTAADGNEGTLAWATGQDGSANEAVQITAAASLRGTITKTFAAETDFTAYTGGDTGTDDDLIEFYCYVAEPTDLYSVTLMIDVNGSSTNRFQDDYYWYEFVNGEVVEVLQGRDDYMRDEWGTTANPPDGIYDDSIEDQIRDVPQPVSVFRVDKPNTNVGWNHFSIARKKLNRVGSTSGKGWKTVKALRFVVRGVTGGSAPVVRFDDVKIVGGEDSPLTGKYRYRLVFAKNLGEYYAVSKPSIHSDEIQLKQQGCTVTVPAGVISSIPADDLVDEIWLYRFGGYLDQYYRVATTTTVTGTPTFSDTLSDRDALILDLPLVVDQDRPPEDILDVAGPYYSRLFCLTPDYLYPSLVHNPDSYSAGQALRVAGAGEVPLWLRQTFGGLFLGTTKDIYRIEGTGAEYPDGTIDLRVTPMNINSPPISEAVAVDGNQLVYLAKDGWRVLEGFNSTSISGDTDLLWRNYIRHGVYPVNITSTPVQPHKAAIAGEVLSAITVETVQADGRNRLWRYSFRQQRWYRHLYPTNFLSIYREDDGTLIAGDDAGFVWTLDVGDVGQAVNQDDGADIPIEIWTGNDNLETPLNRKDLQTFSARFDTYMNPITFDLYTDWAAARTWTVSPRIIGKGTFERQIEDIDPCTLIQVRITGSFSTFRLHDLQIEYLELPTQTWGQHPMIAVNKGCEAVISGYRFRLNTMERDVIFTPIIDHESDEARWNIKTGIRHPTDFFQQFDHPVRCREVAFECDCPIELYDWEPKIMYLLPCPRRLWDTGELDLGRRYTRVRRLLFKVEATSEICITPWFDDTQYEMYKVPVNGKSAKTTIYEINMGRHYHGATPRFVIKSDTEFLPYWLDVIFWPTNTVTEKTHKIRVSPQ